MGASSTDRVLAGLSRTCSTAQQQLQGALCRNRSIHLHTWQRMQISSPVCSCASPIRKGRRTTQDQVHEGAGGNCWQALILTGARTCMRGSCRGSSTTLDTKLLASGSRSVSVQGRSRALSAPSSEKNVFHVFRCGSAALSPRWNPCRRRRRCRVGVRGVHVSQLVHQCRVRRTIRAPPAAQTHTVCRRCSTGKTFAARHRRALSID